MRVKISRYTAAGLINGKPYYKVIPVAEYDVPDGQDTTIYLGGEPALIVEGDSA